MVSNTNYDNIGLNMNSNDNDLAPNTENNNSDNFDNNSDNSGNSKVKNDKRKRESYEPSVWAFIQNKRLTAFRNKQFEKKQKLIDYDEMKLKVELLEKILEENGISLPRDEPTIVIEEDNNKH